MRILLMSDSHGNDKYVDLAMETYRDIDLLIHLGDFEGSEFYIEAAAGCPCVFIRGNNDFNFSLDREKVLEICGKRIYLTHGHNQRVYAGYDRLIRAAKEKDCTIAMFGHTHVPVNRAISGILLINPGSIARPRQADGLPTCMLIDVFDGKEPQIELISFKR